MKHILKLSLRGIRAHLGRLALTFVAISLGVGFVSGSFIIKDSLAQVFDGIVSSANADVDARVQLAEDEFGTEAGEIPDTLIAELQGLPEVGFADGFVQLDSPNQIVPIDKNGEQQVPVGPPLLTFSWDGTRDGATEVFSLDEGTNPGPGQIAIDYAQAEKIEAKTGDVVTFTTPKGLQDFEISGIVRFEGAAGAWFALFDLETAQEQYDKIGIVDGISLGASLGTSEAELLDAVDPVLPGGTEALSNAEVIEDDSADFNEIINFIGGALLAFALVALFVSLFIIYNTFAILVSQRIQEIGMLRAIGASRDQILMSIIFEALIVGLAGSIAGIATGLGVAVAIKALFESVGGFPEASNVIATRTIVVSLLLGVPATMLSALLPAIRASRISPIAAMRNEAPAETSTRRRTITGVVCTGVGLIVLLVGLFASSTALTIASPLLGLIGISASTTTSVLAFIGIGAVLIFVGVAMLSVLFAGPAVNIIGQPVIIAVFALFSGLFLTVVGAVAIVAGLATAASTAATSSIPVRIVILFVGLGLGSAMLVSGLPALIRSFPLIIHLFNGGPEAKLAALAKQNASRSPQRTAATATALMIGLALVTTVAVLGQSLKVSFTSTLETAISADLFVTSEIFEDMPAAVANEIAALDGIEQVSRFRFDEIKVGDEDPENLTGFETATKTDVTNLDLTEGEVRQLGIDEVYIFSDTFEETGTGVGDIVEAKFVDGQTADLTVVGIYDDKSIVDSNYIVDLAVFDQHYAEVGDGFIGATIADTADGEAVHAAAVAVVSKFSQIQVQDNQELLESAKNQVNSLLALINGLLGLAVIVAFFGIVNTIVLSVLERTREIGLMRAIGMTRQQLMTTIRIEALVVCLFGAVLGLVLGVLFAWAAILAIPGEIISTVSIPWGQIVFTLAGSSVLGILAAYLPARRAAKLNVLEAIAS